MTIELTRRIFYAPGHWEEELLYRGDDRREASDIVSLYGGTNYRGLCWTEYRQK